MRTDHTTLQMPHCSILRGASASKSLEEASHIQFALSVALTVSAAGRGGRRKNSGRTRRTAVYNSPRPGGQEWTSLLYGSAHAAEQRPAYGKGGNTKVGPEANKSAAGQTGSKPN